MHPETGMALAHLYRTELLEQASSARLVAEARRHRSTASARYVGVDALHTRPLTALDGRRVAALAAELTTPARFLRHLLPFRSVAALGGRCQSLVSHDMGDAIGAFEPSGRLVAVGCYTRHPIRPDRAEVTIRVVPDYQRRGVGSRVLHELAERAAERGVSRLTATGVDDYRAVVGMAQRSGWRPEIESTGPDVSVAVPLGELVPC